MHTQYIHTIIAHAYHQGAPPETRVHRRHLRGRRFLMWWEWTTFLACQYVAIVTPYLAGFVDRVALELEGENTCIFMSFGGEERLRSFVLICDMLVDVIFWLDIIFSFHLARWIISAEGIRICI